MLGRRHTGGIMSTRKWRAVSNTKGCGWGITFSYWSAMYMLLYSHSDEWYHIPWSFLAWFSEVAHNCTVKFSGHSSQSLLRTNDSGASRLCAFVTLLQCSTPFSSLPLPTEGFYAMERTTTLVVIEAIDLLISVFISNWVTEIIYVSLWTYLRRITSIAYMLACDTFTCDL